MSNDLEWFSMERPQPLPEYPHMKGSLTEWSNSVLQMLTRILESHQSALSDDELILAQNTVQRVREVLTAAERAEDIMQKYLDLEKEFDHTNNIGHLQEHMLAALAKRAGGALLLTGSELDQIGCDDYLKVQVHFPDGEGGMAFCMQDKVHTKEAAEHWAMMEYERRLV